MSAIDPMGFHDVLLQKLDSDYARVKRWLAQCEQWETRLKNAKSIVDVVLHGPASAPVYKKQLRKLDAQQRHLWRREAALLVAHMGMDDSFVSDLSDEELQQIQEHRNSTGIEPVLVALQRRATIRQLQALRNRCHWGLRSGLLNPHTQTLVEEKLAEVEQALARLKGGTETPNARDSRMPPLGA